jgi:hypothetical protein
MRELKGRGHLALAQPFCVMGRLVRATQVMKGAMPSE